LNFIISWYDFDNMNDLFSNFRSLKMDTYSFFFLVLIWLSRTSSLRIVFVLHFTDFFTAILQKIYVQCFKYNAVMFSPPTFILHFLSSIKNRYIFTYYLFLALVWVSVANSLIRKVSICSTFYKKIYVTFSMISS